MKTNFILGLLSVLIISMIASVSAAELKDTTVNYMDYREIVVGDVGVVYKINLENTGTKTKTYEITPDLNAVRQVGMYRVDPSSKITLLPKEKQTIYFYLSLDNNVQGRISIPVNISSGSESTMIELAARPVQTFNDAPRTGILQQLLRIAFFILLVIIFLVLLVVLFRRAKGRRKDRDGKDKSNDEVETYY
jgi:hypothetical protein